MWPWLEMSSSSQYLYDLCFFLHGFEWIWDFDAIFVHTLQLISVMRLRSCSTWCPIQALHHQTQPFLRCRPTLAE